jgi:hypothetical protein
MTYNGGSEGGFPVETVARAGNCQLPPVNVQQALNNTVYVSKGGTRALLNETAKPDMTEFVPCLSSVVQERHKGINKNIEEEMRRKEQGREERMEEVKVKHAKQRENDERET